VGCRLSALDDSSTDIAGPTTEGLVGTAQERLGEGHGGQLFADTFGAFKAVSMVHMTARQRPGERLDRRLLT